MLWEKLAFAFALGIVACAPPAAVSPESAARTTPPAPSASAPAARAAVALPGDVRVRFGDAIDLGWMTLRLRGAAPCGNGVVDATLEIVYRAKPSLGERAFAAEIADDAGAVLGKASPHGFGCEGAAEGETTRSDGTTTKHVYFDAKGGASWLVLPLEEPHGFARYRVMLALRDGLAGDAPRVRAARPAPPGRRAGDPAETDFYRVTPLRIVYCGYTMGAKDLWAAELLVENFSNVPIAFPATGRFVDEQARRYEQSYGERAPCAPALEGAVAPGASARGFVHPIEVARDVKSLDLLYVVTSRTIWAASEVHALHLGALPREALRGAWQAPASREAIGPGYKLTVTALRRCTIGEAGKDYVGVEVLVENTSATEELMGNPSATLEDAASYRHDPALNGALTDCAPSLGNPYTLKPGQKARGWLNLFHVATDTGPWTLHYEIAQWAPGTRGLGARTTIDLALGTLTAAKAP